MKNELDVQRRILNRFSIFFVTVAAILMFVTAFHPYLWGPDEPRDAEISRETYADGKYVTPHFCGLPFVEKPPLYFWTVAGAFHLTGGPSPEAARCVSVLFGCLMLAAVGLAGYQTRGGRGAFLAVLLLLGMPQFYRASHWILLDIALGTFITWAAVLFAERVFFIRSPRFYPVLRFAFWLCCAGAFLTKGVYGIVYIGFIAGGFILWRRRWDLIREYLFDWTVLGFLLPSILWIWLFYCDGGSYNLYEHFVNNTVGRFLHRDFKLPGSPDYYFTDVGNVAPWHFYLGRLPNMFALSLIPGICAGAEALLGFFRNRKIHDGVCSVSEEDAHWRLYLRIWFLLPIVLLSLPAAKEVTYILPGYAALALIGMNWLDRKLSREEVFDPMPAAWVLCVMSLLVLAAYRMPVKYFIAGTGFLLLFSLILLILACRKRQFAKAVFIVLAGAVCGVAAGNTPEVMRQTRLNRKCLYELSLRIWKLAGNRMLYLFAGDETFRGSIPFYGGKTTPALKNIPQLLSALKSDAGAGFVFVRQDFEKLRDRNPELRREFSRFQVHPVSRDGLYDDFVLLLPVADK